MLGLRLFRGRSPQKEHSAAAPRDRRPWYGRLLARADSSHARVILKPYSDAGISRFQNALPLLIGLAATLACLPFGFYYAIVTPWLLVPFFVPIAILMALCIWALPDSNFLPDAVLEKMLFAYFVALVMWPNYIAIDLPGLPWISMARITNAPMVLLFLAALSTSQAFRSRLAEILASSPMVWKTMVVFLILQAISIPFSGSLNYSITQFIVEQTNHTAVFFICCYVFAKPGRVAIWTYLFWAMSIFVGAVGVIEYFHKLPLWSGYIPQFLLINDERVQATLAGSMRTETGQYRTSSVFSTPLGLSEFMALGLPFMMHFASSASYRPPVRALAAVTAVLSIIVVLLTDSRLGLFGLIISIALYTILRAIQGWLRNRTAIIPTAILVGYPAMFVVMISASFFVGRIRAKFWGTGQYDASNEGRKEQLAMGLPKVFQYPLGHGPGRAADVVGYTTPGGMVTIDNFMLVLAVDYGVLGLLAFIGMFGVTALTATRQAFSTERRPAEYELIVPFAVVIIVFLVIKTVFAQNDNHPLMFMMMGVILALSYRFKVLVEARKPTEHSGSPVNSDHSQPISPRRFRSPASQP